MTAYIFYTKDSPDERAAQAFAEDLTRLQVDSKLIEADSSEGIALTEQYDLPGRPAIALVTSDGTLVERWQLTWPQAADISYLAHQ